MEYTILNSYWKKFHGDKVKSFWEVLKKAEKREKILLGILLISAAIGLITDILMLLSIYKTIISGILLFMSIGIEMISVIMLGKYVKEKGIRQTKQNINKIKCGYAEVHEWIKELGYSRKKEIQQFSFRCEELLIQLENEKKENISHMEKMIGLFYVPTLLAIISWILSSNDEMNEIGLYVSFVFLIATAGVIIYLFIICICKIVENSDYSDIKKMKCMIRDLQGVLDYCYDCENDGLELVYFDEIPKKLG